MKARLGLRHFTRKQYIKPKHTKLFIGGKWEKSASGNKFTTIDPHTEEVITEVEEAGVEDVGRAVYAARKAFDEGPWRKFSGQQRAECLFKLAHLIDKHREELALLEALNNGKTLTNANMVDVERSIQSYKYFAGWADKVTGDTISAHGNFFAYTRREPVGVVAQMIPWNYPLMMQAWKLAPALAAGCTVVMKSAEQTPLTCLRVAELAQEAGIPDGVFNMLSGFGQIAGKHLVSHPDIDKISFTGSTKVGLEIMQTSSKINLKRISLDLGGKSPVVVMDDADIGLAVRIVHRGVYANAGQSCNAVAKVFVHENIYDEFVNKSVLEVKKIKLGSQFDKDTTQGPLVSQKQMERVLGYIDSGKSEGAKCLIGGKRHGDKGFHVEPTIFAEVQDHMRIAREEIFGPVMPILKFSTIDEVISRANDSEYGLASAVFTQSLDKAIYLSNALRAGQVYINSYGGQITAPFGGFKNSGIGRELGHLGLNMYLEDKTVIMARPEGSLP